MASAYLPEDQIAPLFVELLSEPEVVERIVRYPEMQKFSDTSTKLGYKRSLLKCGTHKTGRHVFEQPTFKRGGIVSGIEKFNVILQSCDWLFVF